jgi:hypothetical protein
MSQAPSRESLRDELDQVRAASSPQPYPTQPSLATLLRRGIIRTTILWCLLALLFWGIYLLYAPSTPGR